MKLLFEAMKIIIFVVVSFAGIAGLVNGITGWREKNELIRLYLVTYDFDASREFIQILS